MVWECFSYYVVGPIYHIPGIMNQFMLPYAEGEMPLKWVFGQDNDPKHTSKLLNVVCSSLAEIPVSWCQNLVASMQHR